MPSPTLIADIEARFRPLTAEERIVAQSLLDDAWAILLTQKPDLDALIDGGTVSQDIVRFVTASMVLRVLRNPNGVKQWSVDDYSETRDTAVSAGSLYVSPEEFALLSPGGTGDGAFSIRPVINYSTQYMPDPWVPGQWL